MKKKQVLFILLETFILISIILLVSLYMKPSIRFMGFAIYQDQPNETEGKDTYIRENSNTNYGTANILKVGKTAAGLEFKSLLEFNVSSIPSENTVTSAKLEIHLNYSSTDNNITIGVYRVTSEWNETEAAWYNRSQDTPWSTAGGDYIQLADSQQVANTSGWYNFTITEMVQGWVNGTYNNYGLILLSNDAGNGDYKDIDSSDSGDSSLRPRITIDHTPNAAPSISNLSTDTSTTQPKQVGDDVTFTIHWSDAEGDSAQIFVCNSSNINISGCEGSTFCNTSLSLNSPQTCSYTVLPTDNRTTTFYVSACDDTNCSTANQSQFYINHLPNISLIQPDGGETVNQSEGNYPVMFNVSDDDSDLLTADLYYSLTQNSTENLIEANVNLTDYCTDTDADTATTNNCTYPWNSTGIYGTYYMTIILNDSFSISNDTSNSNFSVVSIVDSTPPNITAQWTESYIYSSKNIQIYANVSDPNIDSVWVSINITPQTNLTMYNTSDVQYNVTWEAVEVGTYQFKVYAKDKVGNINDTASWQTFSITKPNVATLNELAPSTSLPYHTIKITGQLNATDSLRDVYAYLNTPDNFTFIQDYPQNTLLGNFTNNETKTATWFLSVPIAEATYTLNITYTDYYSNSWNSSSFNIQVTSSVGGYFVTVSGYPEVETSGTYYAEATFTSGGTKANADSVFISIYDASGSLTVGPAAMSNPSTGVYNYTYTVGASATEGQWETRVNATKSSTSYYSNHFWKVVGGPFDVRNIVVKDNVINTLRITVTTENTGGTSKDLTLVWNLTREDTGALLDSGSDTFAVAANSEKNWTVYPTTTYVGQVRITFLGYYSGTEKAGAYKIFSTTSAAAPEEVAPGVGGGVTVEKKADFKIQNYESVIYLTKNIEKTSSLEVNNTGQKGLSNIRLELEGLDKTYYTVIPSSINNLGTDDTINFTIKLLVTDFVGEKEFNYLVKTNEITKKQPGKLVVLSMRDFFLREIRRLKEKISELKDKIKDKEDLLDELEICEEIIAEIESDVEEENFINAQDNIERADNCIDDVENKFKKIKEVPKVKMEYWVWIITWILILILILILGLIVYLLYKKLNVADFLRRKQQMKKGISEYKKSKREIINKKLQSIEEKLKS
jgi:hypothetical protein